MRKYLPGLLMLLAFVFVLEPCYAKTGSVRITFAKAGLVAGAGTGRGVLTFDGRDHPFTIYGLVS
jgi:hypothetical protein